MTEGPLGPPPSSATVTVVQVPVPATPVVTVPVPAPPVVETKGEIQ